MLRVTVDAFSGRENPTYVLDGAEERDLLRDVSRRRAAITDTTTGFDGLGFRGTIIESLSDDAQEGGHDLPDRFKVGGGGAQDEANALDIAERLIRGLPTHAPAADVDADHNLVDYLLGLLHQPGGDLPTVPDGPPPQAQTGDVTCRIERSSFNPGFWNASGVIGRNNCYNYASNWKTNTFAQPGRGAGQMYTALSCPAVTQAAFADGCHRRFVCFPESEKPRRLVALVVAPGIDYHWYRIHSESEGFWGHKPGGTAARNVDNNGLVITNPETCARGPYTDFCGYFYTCKTQRERIR
jgi:hypothetical protein